MKNILIILLITLIGCHVPTSEEIWNNGNNNFFQGKLVHIKLGEQDHFLKLIGGDSLFVHTTCEEHSLSYIYYTKGCNVNSVSWDTGGKYSQKITNNKNKN